MQDILQYPLPNRFCVIGNDLQDHIIFIMEELFSVLLKKLSETKFVLTHSLLGRIIKNFLECTLLINGNELFMRRHVDKVTLLSKMLKRKVRHMHKNLN